MCIISNINPNPNVSIMKCYPLLTQKFLVFPKSFYMQPNTSYHCSSRTNSSREDNCIAIGTTIIVGVVLPSLTLKQMRIPWSPSDCNTRSEEESVASAFGWSVIWTARWRRFPASLRSLGSGIKFVAEETGWDEWRTQSGPSSLYRR